MIGHHPSSPTSEPASRRRLLRLMGAGGAALVATLLPNNGTRAGHGAADAVDPDALHLGQVNHADARTNLIVEPLLGDQPALSVHADSGRGLAGSSGDGVGVWGLSFNAVTEGHPNVGVEGVAGGGAEPVGVFGRSIINVNEAGLGPGPGVRGESGSGPGVEGTSITGPGVRGSNFSESEEEFGPGVEGASESGPGVAGHSNSGHGVTADSQDGFGVWADSEHVVGVGGFSVPDLGVLGVGGREDSDAEGDGIGGFSHNSIGGRFVSFNGIGLRALSPGDEHPALQAASGLGTDIHETPAPDGGLALEVIGKSRFSTAGSGTVLAGASAASVANSAVTATSHITVTLTSDPGSRQLLWVERQPGTGFTVHLTSAPPPQRPATDFTYLIVEPVMQ